MRRVDRQPREHELERAIQECDVLAEAAGDRIPRPAAGIGRQDGDAQLIGRRADAPQHARAVLRGPMEKDEKRDGSLALRGRHLDDAVAIAAAESEGTALERGRDALARPRRQSGILRGRAR